MRRLSLVLTAALALTACTDDEPAAPARPTVPSGVVSQRVEQSREDLEACRREAEVMDQGTEGTVKLTWTVDPAGAADGFQIAENTVEGDHLADCVIGLVKRWSFPARDAPADAEWTFRFSGEAKPTAVAPEERETLRNEPRGRLDQAAVAEVVRAATPKIDACADAAQAAGGQVAGSLAVMWGVGPDGAVPTARVNEAATTVADPGLRSCVLDEIRTWTFPADPSRLPTQVGWSWNFAVEAPEAAAEAPAEGAGAAAGN